VYITLRDLKAFYGRYGGKIWLFGILGIICFLTIGCIVLPEIFWDKFIYRYYWGPLEVDALESGPITQSDGYVVDQGYTLVSEITYGIVLILALYGIFKLFDRLNIKIDWRFVLSTLPFFFLGGTLRTLEDAELYNEPYVYLFISPVIYFLIAAVIMSALLFTLFLERKESFSLKMKLIFTAMMWVIFDVVYLIIYFSHSDGFNYMVHPLVPIIFSIALLLFFIIYSMKSHKFDSHFALFLFGLFLLAFSIFIITLWPEIDSWRQVYLQAHGRATIETHPLGGLGIVFISVAITLFIAGFANIIKRRYKFASIYTNPINLLIIFGQMFDATATYVGVDFYGYSEKHPIPDFFFQTFGTSAVFLPIKLILALFIVYLIDISFKQELAEYPILKGLIKIIVIVLGLGPGTRDTLRLVMGV
jgi:uncharacterized membrane protein